MGTVVLWSTTTSGRPIFYIKKKVHLPQDEKRLPRTERPTHPPRTTQCTLHPPTDQTFTTYSRTAVQQYVQQYTLRGEQLVGWFLRTLYETGNRRGEFHFLTIIGHLGERASRRPPPTHHPPSTHVPTQYSSTAMQQYVEQYT